jgi:cysteine-rich repeat protein
MDGYLAPRVELAPSARTTLAGVTLLLALLLAPRSASAQLPELVISIGEGATIGGVPAENEDLLLCDPVSLGEANTQCNWSLFLDGSAVGLNSQVMGVDVLPNGSLVIRVAADSSLPDLSAIKRKDLALFIPTDPLTLPYTAGEWRLYLDGDAVKGSSDARVWDAVTVLTDGTCEKTFPMTCDVLLSLQHGNPLGGVDFQDEDILRCHPTAFSAGGSITACSFSLFLDSSAINGGGFGSFTGNLFAFDLLAPDTMIFRASEQATLPAHEGPRDLLRYVGSFGTSPVGTVDFFFDGANALAGAGLDGRTLQALAIYPDADDDGIPDGLDNCPDVPNPGQEDADGDGLGDACDPDPDCNAPVPADADGDGVDDVCDVCDACFDPTNTDSDGDANCDVCDYCPFRADPSCRCGDAVVDPPSEECDLGDAANGAPDSPCTATCEIAGKCTQTGTSCDDASDCPPGEGCCGNGILEGDEECDDGNNIPDDLCANTCVFTVQGVPILGCEDVPDRHLIPAFVKKASFKDTDAVTAPGYDRWKSKGDFNLGDGIIIDPDSEEVRLIFNQAGPAPLYQATLPPGSFFQAGSSWLFFDGEADAPGAVGWRKARLKLKLNKVGDTVDGRNVAIPIDPNALGAPPIRLRQTLRIGDDCATAVITCTAKGTTLKCASTPPSTSVTSTSTTTSTTTTTL